MWNCSAVRLEDAGYVPGSLERTAGPHYLTGTLPLLRVWRIQIEKIAGLLPAAQIFKHPERFK